MILIGMTAALAAMVAAAVLGARRADASTTAAVTASDVWADLDAGWGEIAAEEAATALVRVATAGLRAELAPFGRVHDAVTGLGALRLVVRDGCRMAA